MGYHLSQNNRKTIQLAVKLLSPAKEVKIETENVDRLIYILRTAANTDYPELKNWQFRKAHDGVRCIPKSPLSTQEVKKIDDYMDYLGVISLLSESKPTQIILTSAFLTDKEFEKLVKFCEIKHYSVVKSDDGIEICQLG